MDNNPLEVEKGSTKKLKGGGWFGCDQELGLSERTDYKKILIVSESINSQLQSLFLVSLIYG